MDGNFQHLAAADPQLARLGELAERLFHFDPPTSIAKTRLFAELLAKQVAARGGLELLPRATFEDVLRLLREGGLLPREVGDVFHYVRRVGNVAVHENRGSLGDALGALKLAGQLGNWFRRTFLNDPDFRPGPFRPPAPPVDATADLRAEVERLQQAVREQETAAERAGRCGGSVRPRGGPA